MARDSQISLQRILRARGFTLIEVIIATTLLGLLSILILAAVTFSSSVWKRASEFNDSHDRIYSAQRALRKQLSQIYPEWKGGNGSGKIMFDGGNTQISFRSKAPNASEYQGFDMFELKCDPDGRLLLSWHPHQSPLTDIDETTELLDGLERADFSYYGSEQVGAAGKWTSDWRNKAALPDLIKIEIVFRKNKNLEWPTLVIHPSITVDTNCIYDSVSHGCVGR